MKTIILILTAILTTNLNTVKRLNVELGTMTTIKTLRCLNTLNNLIVRSHKLFDNKVFNSAKYARRRHDEL